MAREVAEGMGWEGVGGWGVGGWGVGRGVGVGGWGGGEDGGGGGGGGGAGWGHFGESRRSHRTLSLSLSHRLINHLGSIDRGATLERPDADGVAAADGNEMRAIGGESELRHVIRVTDV